MSSGIRPINLARGAARRFRGVAHRFGIIGDGNRSLGSRIERLIDTQAPALMNTASVPGLAVVVRLSDGSMIERYFGFADIASGRAIDERTAFQVMSITKPMTAAVCLRLADSGILDLDAPVGRYLRSWDMPRDRRTEGCEFQHVTVRRLLSHSAGLNVHGFGWAPAHGPLPFGHARPTAIELLNGACGEPLCLVHPPGHQQQYSGGGYALVEVVLEDLCSRSFAETASATLLQPLGMNDSDISPTPSVLARLATRYLPGADSRSSHGDGSGVSLLPQPPWVIASGAASGLYTTGRDLCIFLAACVPSGHRRSPLSSTHLGLLSLDSRRSMLTPQMPLSQERGIGLGFHLWFKRTDTIFAHRGYKDGWWSEAIGFARRYCAIALLCNGDVKERCGKILTTRLRQCIMDYAI